MTRRRYPIALLAAWLISAALAVLSAAPIRAAAKPKPML